MESQVGKTTLNNQKGQEWTSTFKDFLVLVPQLFILISLYVYFSGFIILTTNLAIRYNLRISVYAHQDLLKPGILFLFVSLPFFVPFLFPKSKQSFPLFIYYLILAAIISSVILSFLFSSSAWLYNHEYDNLVMKRFLVKPIILFIAYLLLLPIRYKYFRKEKRYILLAITFFVIYLILIIDSYIMHDIIFFITSICYAYFILLIVAFSNTIKGSHINYRVILPVYLCYLALAPYNFALIYNDIPIRYGGGMPRVADLIETSHGSYKDGVRIIFSSEDYIYFAGFRDDPKNKVIYQIPRSEVKRIIYTMPTWDYQNESNIIEGNELEGDQEEVKKDDKEDNDNVGQNGNGNMESGKL